MAQPGRKFFFQVDAHDEQGRRLGSGTLTFLDPPFSTERWGYGVDSGEVPPEFFGGIRGMREAWNPPLRAAWARPHSPQFHYSPGRHPGHTVVQMSHDSATLLTVTLVRICSPRFCSSKSYQLPGTSVRSAKRGRVPLRLASGDVV
jgi:hypothetical protein